MPTIKVSPLKTIMGGADDKFVYNFPSTERLSDGTFYIVARKITSLTDPKGILMAVKYDPATGSVTPMPTPADKEYAAHPERGYYTCHVTELEPNKLIAIYTVVYCDETKPMFSPVDDGMQDTVCRIARSEDGGRTWSDPEELDYKIPDIIVPSRIVKLADGTIGFPAEIQHHYETPYIEPIQGRFIYSVDGGKTFDRAANIPHPKDFLAGDARMTFDDEGNMIIFYWGFDLATTRDLAVYRTITRDCGKTFEHVEPTNLKRQISSPMWIDKDTFLCMYQQRFKDNPGIKCMLSYDSGWNYDPATETPVITFDTAPDTENPFAGFSQYAFGYSTLTRVSRTEALATFWHKIGEGFAISACTISVE